MSNGKTYEKDELDLGKEVYIDRDYTFTSIPGFLLMREFIRTTNDDKFETAVDFLTFILGADAREYVLFDDRATKLPAWLKGETWALDVNTVNTSDVLRRGYYKDFAAGAVRLGGNAMPPMTSAESNYNVVALRDGHRHQRVEQTS